ncbi:hypothetical protein [Virgibacillus oceani]|uniref:Uncharacterized protein n=1 Tax=Virgibacillus oceani TaxID=1479511 RepID=A0A917LVX9_9BACI|nr:hypothetical protein [Virgibacillus oceani]GGG61269.1 hypothetical protein GCM10011398_00690 [Virgibacillus oceani]
MGTFYTIGIIKEFKATSNQHLTANEWDKVLNVRVDLELYDLNFTDSGVVARLESNIFSENITDFYGVFKEILGTNRNPNFDHYEKDFGTDIENYQIANTILNFQEINGRTVTLDIQFVLLFLEGKVMVEEFYTEPALINWLFRNSKIDNKLAGCVVSEVV